MSAQITSSPGLPGREAAKPAKAAAGLPVDSHAVTKRLQSELMSLMASADPGVSAFPDGDSLFSWVGTIHGAPGTVYEGLSYKLSLRIPAGARPRTLPLAPASAGRCCPQAIGALSSQTLLTKRAYIKNGLSGDFSTTQ